MHTLQRLKRICTIGLLIFVAASLGVAVMGATGLRSYSLPSGPQPTTQTSKAPIIVYYFHSNTRCETCRTIETTGETALRDAVKDGRVEWRVVNYQEPAHKHFAQDFELAYASLVLVRNTPGQPLRWKKLKRVWDLYEEPAEFTAYVKKELDLFMEETP